MQFLGIFDRLKGDKSIWGIFALVALLSSLLVYSASTNLVYVVGEGTTWGYLLKHLVLITLGFAIIWSAHKIPYSYYSALFWLAMPVVIMLLIMTHFQGSPTEGTNTSRWINIPFIGMSFQTSTLASIVTMGYAARYFSKTKIPPQDLLKDSLLKLWLPVFIVIGLIFPANFSTAAMLMAMVMVLAYVAEYPFKYLLAILGSFLVAGIFFILVAKAFPNSFSNRVDTWFSRVEHYLSDDKSESYQVKRSKMAIVTGGITGKGPGKSEMKNFLPQSSSDFIYAIIVEEYGLVGGLITLSIYMVLLMRILVIFHKTKSRYGKLLVVAMGMPMVFQALLNMAVAVALVPVTGQTLPLISSGGTSLWVTCISLGVILSVSSGNAKYVSETSESEQNTPINTIEELSGQI